ncbi:MAG: hypothetical protein GY800_05480 [Planctomycetes bacterium]|nr:hypothetical protein [Planctomycetota bacterium]
MSPNDDSHKSDPAPSSQGGSCPAGGMMSTSFIFILLTVLSLAFGVTMMRKYQAVEAKLTSMGLEVGQGGTVQAAQHGDLKAEERAKALEEIAHKLGALKLNAGEIEHLLKGVGVEVKGGKAAGSHGSH